MKKLFLLLVAVLGFAVCASAQNRSVSGTVVDQDTDEPLIGASVVPVGAKTGVTTDVDGNFTIVVGPSVKALEFSSIGYEKKIVQIGSGRMMVKMKSSVEMKDEVIVVAYGTAKRSEYTGSAGVVKADQLENAQVSNVSNALSGKVSGVMVQSSYGQPGSGSKVLIRGVGSISGSVSTNPLYVVDGAPFDGDIATIPTQDIAEMTVLKDAASTALYGARGANGVILITTKRGQEGNARVTVDMRWGSNSRSLARYNTVNDARQYMELVYQGLYNTAQYFEAGYNDAFSRHQYANSNLWKAVGYQTWSVPTGQDFIGANGKFNPNATPGYVAGNYSYYADDWFKNTLTNGMRQEYNMSITGGTQKLNYYVSASYLGDEGIIKSSGFDRFTVRTNVDYQAKPWLKIGTNIAYAYTNQRAPGDQSLDASTSVGNAFNMALNIGPVYPMYIRDPQGNLYADPSTGHAVYDYGDGKDYGYGRTPSRNTMSSSNPLGDLVYDREEYLADVLNTRFYMTLTPVEGLTVTGTAAYMVDNTRMHYIKNPLYGSGAEYKGQAIQAHDRSRSINLNALASYNKSWGDHNMDIMLSFENQSYRLEDVQAAGQNLYNPHSWAVNNTIDQRRGYGYELSEVHRGVLARAKYNYAGRYYVVGSIRRDGSSRFAPGHRWGTFWSASAGWDIAKEGFMKDTKDYVDMLKYKFSIGQTGNDGIGTLGTAYADLYQITGSDGVWSDGTLYYKGNRDITWETSTSLNTGFDFSFFKGKLSGTFEYYQRQTSNMLFNVPVAPSLGYSSVPMNVGKMRNNGFELDLNWNAVNTKDISLDVYANITNTWNKVLKLEPKLLNTYESWEADSKLGWLSGSRFFTEGESMYQLWLVEYAGVNNDANLKNEKGELITPGEALYVARRNKTDKDGNVIYQKDAAGKELTDFPVMEEYLTNNYSAAYNSNRKSTGNLMPKAYGGFGFDLKAYGFELQAQCAYQFGGRLIDSAYQTYMSPVSSTYIGQAYHKDLLNAWTPTNTNTDVPRVQSESKYSAANATSTRFLISSNYLSLNNVTLGYHIPAKFTQRFMIDGIYVYFTGENLALWSKRKGLDPRQGFTSSDNATYSPIRTLSGGVRVNF